MMTDIRLLRALTDEERLDAQDRAKALILREIGQAPKRDDFQHHATSKYPAWVTRLTLVLVTLVLVAAFAPSAIRLFSIGQVTFFQAIPHELSATVAGLAIVLLAESAQVLFSIASATLPASRATRFILALAMLGATMLALVGNIQVALVGHWSNPFAWLEAILPPLMTLATAYILKEQLLTAIRANYASAQAHAEALANWRKMTASPETAPRYPQALANSLKAALVDANSKGTGAMSRKELIASLTSSHWRALIQRELQADAWWAIEDATPSPVPAPAFTPSPTPSPDIAIELRLPPTYAEALSPESEVGAAEDTAPFALSPLPAPAISTNGNGRH